MSFTERTLAIPCEGETLQAIVSSPLAAAQGTAVVIVVGGPQYRVGSHRQFCLLARGLAAAGYPTLRFDCRGMGDSSGAQRDFLSLSADIGSAIDAIIAAAPGVDRVVLWGLCDAASAALVYLHERSDPRVRALCLLNPWVRSDQTLAQARVSHYYRDRLLQPSFWKKLLSGQVAFAALRSFVANVKLARGATVAPGTGAIPFQDVMAAALLRHPLPTLLLLSGQDITAQEFLAHAERNLDWQHIFAGGALSRHDLPDADHTFSSAASRQQVERLTRQWLDALPQT